MKDIYEIIGMVRNADYSTDVARLTINRIMVQALHTKGFSDNSRLNYIRNRLCDCKTYCVAKSWEMCYDFNKAIKIIDKEMKDDTRD